MSTLRASSLAFALALAASTGSLFAQPAPRPPVRPAPARPGLPARPAVTPRPAPAAQRAPTAPEAPATPTPPPAETPPTIPAPPGTPAAVVQPATPPADAAHEGPRVAVVDAAPLGVDPAAAQYVTHVLRTSIHELGFSVIPTAELHDAARRIQLPFPVPPEGMLALERALQAPAAATAEVRAAQGMYVVRLRVRVASESQERTHEVSASQFQLADAIRSVLPILMAPPRDESAPVALLPGTPPGPGAPPTGPVAQPGGPEAPNFQVPRRRRVRAHPRRWELGVGGIVAFGPGRDAFVNALAMARVGWFPMDRVGFTATLSYANLNAREGRRSNILMALGVETAVDLAPASHIFIPLRAEVGYLPANGPVFRITAGLSFQLARRVRLELDLLSPALWIIPDGAPVSLDVGARVHFGL